MNGDFDLHREAALDRWHDEPSPAEMERLQRESDEYAREVQSRPVGTHVARTS